MQRLERYAKSVTEQLVERHGRYVSWLQDWLHVAAGFVDSEDENQKRQVRVSVFRLIGLVLLGLIVVVSPELRGTVRWFVVYFAFAVAALLLARYWRYSVATFVVMLFWDIYASTLGVHLMGSLNTSLVIFYPLAVVFFGIQFGFFQSLAYAVTGCVFYTGLVILELMHIIPYAPLLGPEEPIINYPLHPFVSLLFVDGTIMISAFATGLLMYEIHTREGRLLENYESLKLAKDQLAHTEAMAAVGQLAAGAAHELNNPLASASSLIQTSLKELEDPAVGRETLAEVREDLTYALAEQDRAKRIVERLLDITRHDHGYSELLDMNRIVLEASSSVRARWEPRGVAVEARPAEDLPRVMGNFPQLSQLCLQLMENAAEAAPAEGGRVEARLSTLADRVVLEVTDNGCGISEENLKEIFRPFFTTKHNRESVGLGLYLCHEIIFCHGGGINVESLVGEGTVITVELPAFQAGPEETEKTPEEGERPGAERA